MCLIKFNWQKFATSDRKLEQVFLFLAESEPMSYLWRIDQVPKTKL